MNVVAVIWAAIGVLGLFGSAIYRLGVKAWTLVDYPLSTLQLGVLVVFVAGMAYAEGYRGFQMAYAPRVAARLKYLFENPTLKRTLLAPVFCMGFFDIQRRRQISTIILTSFIVVMILSLHLVAQPWRAIIDAGVVVGLSWGVTAIAIFSVRAFVSASFEYSPEMPHSI